MHNLGISNYLMVCLHCPTALGVIVFLKRVYIGPMSVPRLILIPMEMGTVPNLSQFCITQPPLLKSKSEVM